MTDQPTDDHHVWVAQTLGVDPRAYSAAPPVSQAPASQAPASQAPSAVDPATLIGQWLDKHQFAPPATQPDGAGQPAEPGKDNPPELHVLLNAEDMELPDAVKLAVADLKQPEALVRSTILAKLKPNPPRGLNDLPVVGPANEVPGVHLGPPSPETTRALLPVIEMSTIDTWLTNHKFGRAAEKPGENDTPGSKASLDGNDLKLEDIADRALLILGQYPAVTRDQVIAHLRQKYVAAPKPDANTQIIVGYTVLLKPLQAVPGPKTTQHQFSFTLTKAHHDSDSGGFETSFQGTLVVDEHWKPLNVSGVVQEALVKSILGGWIQVSGLAQAGAAVNFANTFSGTTKVTASWQFAGGVQVLVTPTFKCLGGHFQIGVQALGGVQSDPQDGHATPGASLGGVVNVPFDVVDILPGHKK